MIELADGALYVGGFLSTTIGIVVLFAGKRLNESIGFLREFSIPEPVSGGLLVSLVTMLVFTASGIAVEFELAARDYLLVYFFTTIGINASVKDLLAGGKPLVILLVITLGYMVVQDLVGVGAARLFGQSGIVGLLGGSVSLTGGHGTAIAWSPVFSQEHGIGNAMEIGMTCATFGLILASVIGGPIAKFLIGRHQLHPAEMEPQDVGIRTDSADEPSSSLDYLDAVLAIHICILLGLGLNTGLGVLGLDLPLFVTCLFAGILVTNLIPESFPRLSGRKWPSRSAPVALIADVSLGTFLAMSLMSLQIWTLLEMAGPILGILALQTLIAVAFILLLVFPAMGRSYDAAVISSGFAGVALGATPTAMANMSAVTARYGGSHLAFIIVPLVCAFFVDLFNALLIPFFLNHLT